MHAEIEWFNYATLKTSVEADDMTFTTRHLRVLHPLCRLFRLLHYISRPPPQPFMTRYQVQGPTSTFLSKWNPSRQFNLQQ